MNTLDTTNSTAVAALDFKVKPVAFLYSQGAKARSLGIGEISPTLKTDHNPVVAFAQNQRDEVRELAVAGALPAQPGAKQQTYVCRTDMTSNAAEGIDMAPTLMAHAQKAPPFVYPQDEQADDSGLSVRRLLPIECERIQGFPDSYTDVPYRGKPHPTDGPRYKALGNSMAVPVMQWIGERIQQAEEHDSEMH